MGDIPRLQCGRALKLFEQAKKITEGAALMTNASVSVDVISAVWPVRGNRTLAELFQRGVSAVVSSVTPKPGRHAHLHEPRRCSVAH
jgi:metal-dependent amidase/aminoacylase/carboxypeptidase family protein